MAKVAWVLMTAMPPTVGHLNLIKFAHSMSDRVIVVLNTQPDEPYATERATALREATHVMPGVHIFHKHETLPQSPEDCDDPADFWNMWADMLEDYGFLPGDYIVASEEYAIELASVVDGKFMPYDPERELQFSKATFVRDDLFDHWDWVLPEFQQYVRPRVTIFGAESTGKTTLSQGLAQAYDGQWLFEYARPYLEMVGPQITTESMTDIWRGQLALQQHAHSIAKGKIIVQDTDLFSTVGYWGFWQPTSLPSQLETSALQNKSDLYIVQNSNIPFEEDPIRYGGDKRESDDQYWIDLCERYGLNYKVMQATTPTEQLAEAQGYIDDLMLSVAQSMNYERRFNA